ncbi:MAG: hypothetical protein KGI06_01630 [Candidatus Micrarchaeota archaeon]|nr:hypothetical protein [Candidatus Micrarchaeota archaeon]
MARFYGLDAGISIGVTAFMLTGPDTGALLRSGEITGFAAAASGIGAYYLAMHLLRKEQ